MPMGPLTPEHCTAAEVAAWLNLEPLDREGGFFRRTAESALVLPAGALPSAYGGPRRAYSTIYALFTPEGFSALHRLATDEVWCFHAGDPLEQLRLYPDGTREWMRLGADLAAGSSLQTIVPAGAWQGTRLVPGGRWALVTCVVAPEFVWSDFELAEFGPLAASYANFADEIRALIR